ncbi:MAG: histidinol dehydrogenase [Acidobacteriia bacterium]|nr:histidinol dehydrogenase [Methyloceanibacter sp.]MCL6491590.1 histidinol dehydrogenase [Terriglobia bacterium]
MREFDTADAGFAENFAALLAAQRAVTVRVGGVVAEILAEVKARGDDALLEFTRRFDRLSLSEPAGLHISEDEIEKAVDSLDPRLLQALDLAASRIEAFHRAQLPADLALHDSAGMTLGLRWTPLDAVGLYVPGGKAAYPSSVLMNALPARIAGVKRIAMCVPTPDGLLNPLVLAAAKRAGVGEIYRVGGAQAIAALAFGTNTIAPVDRIVGPGNAYVAEAKRQVFGHVGIDSIAGPSEVVVLADGASDPHWVALDLLAQAEHDESAQAILITKDRDFARAVIGAIAAELESLPRAEIARASLQANGAIILVRDWEEAAELVNRLAPEHVEIMLPEADAVFARIRHAGAAFLGPLAPEAVGDYVAGPNHVLPTGRSSRFASGLSVFDFLKRTTWVAGDQNALAEIGQAAVLLAEAEGLEAHARSVAVRLQALDKKQTRAAAT